MRIDGIPASDLENVIDLKILEWSPYPETGRYITRMGKYLLIWIWDQEKHFDKARKFNAQQVQVFPETVMSRPEQGEMTGLYRCVAGFEGRMWEQGILTAGHWWPEMPSAEQWFRFLLRNDHPPMELPATPVAMDLLVKPWGPGYGTRLVFNLLQYEFVLVKILALILALYLSWLGGIALKTRDEIASVSRKIEIGKQQAAPILADRTQALEYLEKIKQLSAVGPFPSQLLVMNEVIRIIPGAMIRKWVYRDGTLTILLTGKDLDPRLIIEQLDTLGRFSHITAQRGRQKKQLEIHLQVQAKNEQ